VFNLLDRFIGPGSFVGQIFAWLGYPFTSNPGLQYVFGTLVLIVFIYLLGLIVESGMKVR
jgi:energy-converting hydrogenase Eha subunit B